MTPGCASTRRRIGPSGIAHQSGGRHHEIGISGGAHGEISKAIGMQLVSRAAGRGIENQLWPQLTGGCICCRAVEVDNQVEETGRPQIFVEDLPAGVVLSRSIRRIGITTR